MMISNFLGEDGQTYSERENSSSTLESALASDDVQTYLREIARYKQLTAAEEIYYGNRALTGDEEAMRTIFLANLRLVVRFAKLFKHETVTLLDRIQEGNLGLYKAVYIKRFDTSRGTRFSTHASWWIRQAITRAIQDQSRTKRIPVYVQERIRKLQHFISKYQQENDGTPPSYETIAVHFDYTIDYVYELLQIDQQPIYLSQRADDGNEESDEFANILVDELSVNPRGLSQVDKEEMYEILEAALTDREYLIISLRYGLDGNIAHTLIKVGKILGVSRERVRQIEEFALNKLRTPYYSSLLKRFN